MGGGGVGKKKIYVQVAVIINIYLLVIATISNHVWFYTSYKTLISSNLSLFFVSVPHVLASSFQVIAHVRALLYGAVPAKLSSASQPLWNPIVLYCNRKALQNYCLGNGGSLFAATSRKRDRTSRKKKTLPRSLLYGLTVKKCSTSPNIFKSCKGRRVGTAFYCRLWSLATHFQSGLFCGVSEAFWPRNFTIKRIELTLRKTSLMGREMLKTWPSFNHGEFIFSRERTPRQMCGIFVRATAVEELERANQDQSHPCCPFRLFQSHCRQLLRHFLQLPTSILSLRAA